MVFFVLSGFFVGGSVLGKSAPFQWKQYVVARLVRLWVVLLPALALTALVDALVAVQAPAVLAGDYQTVWNSGPTLEQPYSESLKTLIGNIAFLQTVIVPVYGVNGPLWSLANEFWYYVLFPLCAIVAGGIKGTSSGGFVAASRVIALCVILLLLAALPATITSGYPIWLLGLLPVIVRVRLNRFVAASILMIGGLLMLVAFALSRRAPSPATAWISSDLLTGIGFCVMCVALVNTNFLTTKTQLFSRLARGLSEISYSLYLSHFPLIVVIGALGYDTQKLQPNLSAILQFVGWLSLLLAASWVFWLLLERHSQTVRRLVSNQLTRRAASG